MVTSVKLDALVCHFVLCWCVVMERVRLDQSALQAVEEYWEYTRIVGEDDGGTLFTPQQYEEYKRRVVPRRVQNRLYVSFGVPGGIDCKLIGPETPCFCTHRYKQHHTEHEELQTQRPLLVPCRVSGCPCGQYQYVPHAGSRPVRCRCKHLPEEHSAASGHLCSTCRSCRGFYSPSACGCGQPYSAHRTLIESRHERQARGAPLGRDVPYAAMGGLTGFSSLMDGYLRLDSSGTGVGGAPGVGGASGVVSPPAGRSVCSAPPPAGRSVCSVSPPAAVSDGSQSELRVPGAEEGGVTSALIKSTDEEHHNLY